MAMLHFLGVGCTFVVQYTHFLRDKLTVIADGCGRD